MRKGCPMIIVDGIESAIVGWANLGSYKIAVYSVDRLSNLIDDDMNGAVSVDDIEAIVGHLEDQVSDEAKDQNMPPPIFVRTGDWEDIEREIIGG